MVYVNEERWEIIIVASAYIALRTNDQVTYEGCAQFRAVYRPGRRTFMIFQLCKSLSKAVYLIQGQCQSINVWCD